MDLRRWTGVSLVAAVVALGGSVVTGSGSSAIRTAPAGGTPPLLERAAQEDGQDGQDGRVEREDFSVEHREVVPEDAAERVADMVAAAVQMVTAYLEQASTWEGPPYETALRVIIDPSRGPYQAGSTIHVPEARVLHLHAGDTEQRTDLGIVHEITHVLAASAGREEGDRFYDDGLAVFLEHRFGQSGYPNFGSDLYFAFVEASRAHAQPIPLAKSEEVRNANRSRAGRRLAYIQEGAFTQYLIERFGLEAYFEVFHGATTEEAVSVPMDELEADWRSLMANVVLPSR